MRKTEWHEAGNDLYKTGNIERTSVGLGWWLLDTWLAWVHPHWDWWNSAWSKLIPNWGDPFCAAYCLVWSNFYHRRVRSEHLVEVGFDRLSEDYRTWYAAEMLRDEDEDSTDEDAAS